MLNSNSEETPISVGSSVNGNSKISKLTGKYFNFHLKNRKESSSKLEENCESIKNEPSSGRNSDFLKNLKKKLQFKKLMPSKSRQRIKVQDNEISINNLSERSSDIQEQIKINEQTRDSSNPVNSYIAALVCNGENLSETERIPRLNDFVSSQSDTVNSEAEKTLDNLNADVSQEGETSFRNSQTNENNLSQLDEMKNNNRENTNKDDSEGKSGTKATLIGELLKLSKYGWYWGPISRDEADSKLTSEPDGAFLIRDSSDCRYLLTLSFKSVGKIRHSRMEYSSGLFSLCNHSENQVYTSVVDLINHSMTFSQSSIFCYSRSRNSAQPSFPVRLTKPVSRFTQVRSLQYLCRFVIRQNTRLDNIHKLPLPKPIREYIEEAYY